MIKKKKNQPLTIDHWPSIFFLVVLLLFLFPVFRGKIPIPADTILGMYHPWRDKVWNGLTKVPFKNFLITDPVRQQYPWKELAVSSLKKFQIPFWNPYTFSGTPLLANFQTAPFYPLNFLFFILPFKTGWTVFIVLQQILAGIFLYFYLRHFKLKKTACLLGCLAWVFSGFFVAWWEWGTIIHTCLWLPLILLSTEKIFDCFKKSRISNFKPSSRAVRLSSPSKSQVEGFLISNKKIVLWSSVLVFSLASSFLAGHLQISFYVLLISLVYIIAKLAILKGNRKRLASLFIIHYSLFIVFTAIQWLPSLEFIRHSARAFDQADYTKEGWFIPWQNLAQFFAPDFFGNPATLNYWGKWNYAEFVGYIGIIPLIFSLLAIFWRRDKKSLFFSLLILFSLVFALPTPLAKLPYKLRIPFLSTSQPTRLMFVVDLALAILAALGLDWVLSHVSMNRFLNTKMLRKTGVVVLFLGLVFGGLWLFVFSAPRFWPQVLWLSNLSISKRNLILPTVLFLAFCVGGFMILVLDQKIKRKFLLSTFYFLLFGLAAFDLLRFAKKFTPFVKSDWLFPGTKTVQFLKSDPEIFRFMATDRRLFPPNFSVVYRLQTVEGYDPLYLERYGQLVAAWERNRPDISPFSFNRILRPVNFDSKITDFLNVKYVLSLSDLDSEKLSLVFREGETRVYENKSVFPRAFWVGEAEIAENDQETIDLLFDPKIDLREKVIIEEPKTKNQKPRTKEGEGRVEILNYQENRVVLEVESNQEGFVVLTDSFYPGWRAEVDGEETEILRANHAFRAIKVQKGERNIVFSYQPLSFKIGLALSAVGIIGLAIVYKKHLLLPT